MANNEHCNTLDTLVAECGRMQEIQRVKCLITNLRRQLKDKIISDRNLDDRQCPPEIVALFLMAEKLAQFRDEVSRELESYLRNDSSTNINGSAETDSQIENKLWTLFVYQESVDGSLSNDNESMLSAWFNILACRQSHVVCLMLWLFPHFATKERMDVVERIVADEKNATLLLWDKMLFWLACMRDSDYGKEKNIGSQINGLLSDSGAFAVKKEMRVKGDIRSCALRLLVLISYAKLNDLDDEMVWQKVRCMVEYLTEACDVDEPYVGWVYYSLCEFVQMSNDPSVTA